jgi:glucose/arabinose dehydrogenase
LHKKDLTVRIGTKGLPVGARLEHKFLDHKIVLRLPAHDQPITFRVFVASGVTAEAFKDVIRNAAEPEDLPSLCKGGPARWKETITTTGKLGSDDGAYTFDTIPLPDKNPWNSWMRPGAIDFFRDGRAALATWNGDVWIVSGLDAKLDKVTWKRYATGIFEALGLRIVNDVVYVLGRDQITRLHDLNGDGEADFYENFNNDGPTAPSFHSFALELHTDSKGNFYYIRGAHRIKEGTPMHGGVIKVAHDGSKAELICHGVREANGMSVGPDDTVTMADNQGNWVPTSRIDLVKPGAFYGYRWGFKDYPVAENPMCWLPYSEDNSSGGQAWVPDERWGPFKGHMVHTSFGSCKLFKVFVQRDGARAQGGIVAFPFVFETGIHRARFNPADGQLYLCGLKGWGTTAKADGGFYRVRYTGKPVLMPTDLRVSKDRIAISFAVPLDRASLNVATADVEQWTYDWSEKYGSKDYSIANPGKLGRDKVTVNALSLGDDGKTVRLDIPGLKPVMQMGITLMGLRTKDGAPLRTTVYNTINYVP